jgi:hypothetical protein
MGVTNEAEGAMTVDRHTPASRVYAELPSGQLFVPGDDLSCPGPDAFGLCRLADCASERPCAGATWHYDGAQPWRFLFRADSSVCPVAVLDPLGPLPVPLD